MSRYGMRYTDPAPPELRCDVCQGYAKKADDGTTIDCVAQMVTAECVRHTGMIDAKVVAERSAKLREARMVKHT